MSHNHSIYDSDKHFSINPITRAIKNESGKVILIQHDHNSERFTFEIPRKVEEHDMSLCNKVQIHFINIDAATKEKHSDIYEVDDLQISPESDDIVICSWLVSGNATQFVGNLNFVIRFSCVADDGTVEYAWNTAVHSGVSVSTGIYNSDAIYDEHFDILEQWKAEIIKRNENQILNYIEYSIENNAVTILSCDESISGIHIIPDTIENYPVTKIGSLSFFHCENLLSITIPDSVTAIWDGAFDGCKSLKSITIPDSITSINDGAFSQCSDLADIYYKGTQEQWDAIQKGSGNGILTSDSVTIHYNQALATKEDLNNQIGDINSVLATLVSVEE